MHRPQANGRVRSAQIVYDRTLLKLSPVHIDFIEGTRPTEASQIR